jgi:hypothetical protein
MLKHLFSIIYGFCNSPTVSFVDDFIPLKRLHPRILTASQFFTATSWAGTFYTSGRAPGVEFVNFLPRDDRTHTKLGRATTNFLANPRESALAPILRMSRAHET